MPFADALKNHGARSTPSSGRGGFASALQKIGESRAGGAQAAVKSFGSNEYDLDSVDSLLKLAQTQGVLGGDEIADEDKLSFLERLSAGLGSLNPAEAIMRQYEGTESFLTAYPKTVVQGIVSGITGNDYGEQTKKRYFGEVVEAMGVENKYARFGLGLVGDILLDPSTYVGGSIVRLGAKGVGLRTFVSEELELFAKKANKFENADEFVRGFRNEFGEKMQKSGFHMDGKAIYSRKGGKLISTKELFEKAKKPHLLMEVMEKINPELATGIRATGEGIKEKTEGLRDALGSLFKFGHKTSGDFAENYLEYIGDIERTKTILNISNARRMGSDVLTDAQLEDLYGYIFRGKSAEFNFTDGVVDEFFEAFNSKFPDAKFALKPTAEMRADLTKKLGREASDVEVRSAVRTQAVNRLKSVTRSLPKKIGKLQALRDRLAKPFIADDLLGMKEQVKDLLKELDELIGTDVKKVAKDGVPMASKEQIDSALMNALGSAKQKYTDMIIKLHGQLDAIESGVLEPVMREVKK